MKRRLIRLPQVQTQRGKRQPRVWVEITFGRLVPTFGVWWASEGRAVVKDLRFMENYSG